MYRFDGAHNNTLRVTYSIFVLLLLVLSSPGGVSCSKELLARRTGSRSGGRRARTLLRNNTMNERRRVKLKRRRGGGGIGTERFDGGHTDTMRRPINGRRPPRSARSARTLNSGAREIMSVRPTAGDLCTRGAEIV